MKIKRLDDGTLIVPKRVEGGGVLGDSIIEIKPNHTDYQKHLEQYQREQELELDKNKDK